MYEHPIHGLDSHNRHIQLASIVILGSLCTLFWIVASDYGLLFLLLATVASFLLRKYWEYVHALSPSLTSFLRALALLATPRWSSASSHPSLPGPSAPTAPDAMSLKAHKEVCTTTVQVYIKRKAKPLVQQLYADYSQRPALSRIAPLQISLPKESAIRTNTLDTFPHGRRWAFYPMPPTLPKLHAMPGLVDISRMPLARLSKRDYSHIRPWILPSRPPPKPDEESAPKKAGPSGVKASFLNKPLLGQYTLGSAPSTTPHASGLPFSLTGYGSQFASTSRSSQSVNQLPRLPGPPGVNFSWPKAKVPQMISPPLTDDPIEIDDPDALMGELKPRSPTKPVFDLSNLMQVDDGKIEDACVRIKQIKASAILNDPKSFRDVQLIERMQNLYRKGITAWDKRPCLLFTEMQRPDARIDELVIKLGEMTLGPVENPNEVQPPPLPAPVQPASTPTTAPTPATAPTLAPTAAGVRNPEPHTSNSATVAAPSSMPPVVPSSSHPLLTEGHPDAVSSAKAKGPVSSNSAVSPGPSVETVATGVTNTDPKGKARIRGSDEVDQDVASRAGPSTSASSQAKGKGKAVDRSNEEQRSHPPPQAQANSSNTTESVTLLSAPNAAGPSTHHFTRNEGASASASTSSEAHSSSVAPSAAVTFQAMVNDITLDSEDSAPSNLANTNIPQAASGSSSQSQTQPPPPRQPDFIMPVIAASDWDPLVG